MSWFFLFFARLFFTALCPGAQTALCQLHPDPLVARLSTCDPPGVYVQSICSLDHSPLFFLWLIEPSSVDPKRVRVQFFVLVGRAEREQKKRSG